MAKIASSTYCTVYAEDNPLRIKAMWQELSISYATDGGEKTEGVTRTLKLALELFYALAKRDHILKFGNIQKYDILQK